MGLFKDFKEDFSQAVNELVPGETPEENTTADNLVVDTLGEDVDVESELSKLDGLLEQVNNETKVPEEKKPVEKKAFEPQIKSVAEEKEPEVVEPIAEDIFSEKVIEETESFKIKEEKVEKMNVSQVMNTVIPTGEISDETSVITASTMLTGDLSSSGSFDIQGTINGNITCNGKIVVTGTVNGNTNSSEFFADVAKIEGEVNSSGTVKIGAGSVIIGNISASSAVIAGAVKGDIDVQGPVVVDTSAVIMGNIKSRSVQINNGAVIEGFCSQSYADIDVQGLFDND